MVDELDIVGVLRNLRKTEFTSKCFLKDYQRFFVSKFHSYHISADDDLNEEVRECNEYEANLTKAGGPKDDDKVVNNDTSKGVKNYSGDYL